MAAKRLTQRDIARLAGVSQATVSLVLNNAGGNDGRIPVETRDRVNKVIRETGYVADPVARRMVKGLNR
ncbi:MAG: LacI family DNA-binding transcriptional regulator, partial [Achromobacter pestifer]